MSVALINLCYLGASILFVVGLKGLTHPRTAARGNLLSALGMLVAVVVTLIDRQVVTFDYIIAGVAVGALIGVILAVKIKMTDMPQLVALFNGFGGVASVLVAGAVMMQAEGSGGMQVRVATVVSGLIGAVTFWGSLIAFDKLQEFKIFWKAPRIPGGVYINALLALGSVAVGVWSAMNPGEMMPYWGLVAVGSVLGVMLVLPIGGADMPVVVALLNSYSGLAAAATGFVLNNTLLILTGSLVGASGIILTHIMCKAMNRSLANVLFGRIEAEAATASADDVYAGRVKSTSAEEVAMLLETARKVVFVPGYGMAVAQAQFVVRDLFQLLEDRDLDVEFSIHPVAGRMPGHMNVLLAEVNIPYDKLKAMEEVNDSFGEVDVCIVIGANDVVNPDARENPESPIAGMPILNVDHSRAVIVIKRSLSPGFAGIPNPLFALDNTLMLFGDGKKMIVELVAAMKDL